MILLLMILNLKTWKIESSSESEEEYEDEQDQPHGIENTGDKVSNDSDFYAWYRHKKKHILCIFQYY